MIFSHVYVAEWPPFLKELLIRLIVCFLSFTIMSICNFGCFHFGFEVGVVVLIVPGPGH